jgi:hypothetical protein
MLLIGLKQKWYLHDSAKRSGNFSADVFLNCSFNYIGFILPPSQQNNSLDSKIVETP